MHLLEEIKNSRKEDTEKLGEKIRNFLEPDNFNKEVFFTIFNAVKRDGVLSEEDEKINFWFSYIVEVIGCYESIAELRVKHLKELDLIIEAITYASYPHSYLWEAENDLITECLLQTNITPNCKDVTDFAIKHANSASSILTPGYLTHLDDLRYFDVRMINLIGVNLRLKGQSPLRNFLKNKRLVFRAAAYLFGDLNFRDVKEAVKRDDAFAFNLMSRNHLIIDGPLSGKALIESRYDCIGYVFDSSYFYSRKS